jgi:hypothetical protein
MKQLMKEQDQIQLVIETITPGLAAEYLKFNRSNRRLVEHRVAFYQRQMSGGEWKLSGDSIKFDRDNLIDGQHRLQAVVRSGVTIESVVVRNLGPDVFDCLDTGRSRQAGDVLSSYGYANVFILASAGRYIYHFERKIVPATPTLTNQDILSTIVRHRDLPGFISDCNVYRFAKSGIIVASLYWLEQCDLEKAPAFIEKFLKGTELKLSNPIYALRERIIADRSLLSNKRARVITAAMFFRTFENWVSGKPASRMSAVTPSAADFPWPAGTCYLSKP